MLLAQQASGIATAEGDDRIAFEHRAFDDPVDQRLLHRRWAPARTQRDQPGVSSLELQRREH